MTQAQQDRAGQAIKEVAGCLNAAGHDLARAVLAGRAISEEDGHDLAQLECAVKLFAASWSKRLEAAAGKGRWQTGKSAIQQIGNLRYASRD